ncbi:MAG: hypothetical protein CMJ83_18710 [Planctomycetes bacterium]|nr:hypothetical protein [Planctomycetota bacterium]
MRFSILTVVSLLLAISAWTPLRGQGASVGFAEDFALADVRAEVLTQLIPGTRTFYYYQCIERQHAGKFGEVAPLLATWIERHGRSRQVEEIENRQALLTQAKDPSATYEYLRKRLGLQYDHHRNVPGATPALPTRLDPELLSRKRLTERALTAHPGSLSGFSTSALESLAAAELDAPRLANLLDRLRRPDVPNLAALVVRDLETTRSRGFGSRQIHERLLLAQLEECARLRPALLQEGKFINAWLTRLQPGADVEWRRDAQARQAYLDRLESFVARLSPAQNSLKAHVIHHRLTHDLAQGRHDKKRFMAWLRLPRRSGYVRRDYLGRHKREEVVDPRRSYPTKLGSPSSDEALLRTYLGQFFVTEATVDPYADFVKRDYLERVFAETKILAGVGDMERWYSLLDDPAYYEQLKDRVEISFALDRRRYYGAADAVSLDVDIKNVDTLLVKVFEVNTPNYYADTGKEVDATLPIEGLVASEETTHTYQVSPFRRVRRTFKFPSLNRPGVFIIDFIGNGRSSRAVINKGRLSHQVRGGAAGHVFRVLDHGGRHLKDASIRLGAKRFGADESGEILVPYSTRPATKKIVLRHGEFASLGSFQHEAESYRLDPGFYVDREALVANGKAQILLRPALLLNGQPVSLALLEDPVLTIRSETRRGIASTLEVRDIVLHEDQETVHEINVPDGLKGLSVRLRGRVTSISLDDKVSVASSEVRFRLNLMDSTARTMSPLLVRTPGGYVLDFLGKNGEPVGDHAVTLSLTHRHFADRVDVSLKTNANGRIELGPLTDVTHLTLPSLPAGYRSWALPRDQRTYPEHIHAPAGVAIRVPYQGAAKVTSRAVVSLLERRGGVFVRDGIEHVTIKDGFVELRGLTAGDYDLWLKEADRHAAISVGAGRVENGWVMGKDRMLRVSGLRPLHVTKVAAQGKNLVVECENTSPETRVHVFATRYVAPYEALSHLGASTRPAPPAYAVRHPESVYASGRRLDDEHRYILERRYAKKFPGNMLKRPSILLNPWALREANDVIGLGGGAGGAFGGRRGGKRNLRARGGGGKRHSDVAPGIFASVDFLPASNRVLANLRPDANGRISIPLDQLGNGHLVHVVALDGGATVTRTLALPPKPLQARDRRLEKGLDPKKHFAEQKIIEFVDAGKSVVIPDVATSSARTYDSLASVFQLYQTLGGGPALAKFAFLLEWPKLDQGAKRSLYSEHACHELHFFLHEKDPAFFAAVIKPYIANKAHRTFLDHWLLGDDLKRYLDPWRFGKLNVFERILLSKRVDGQAGAGARHVRELWELLPPRASQLDQLFDRIVHSDDLYRHARGTGFGLSTTPDASKKRPSSPKRTARDKSRDGKAQKEAAPEEEVEEEEMDEKVNDEPVAKDTEVFDHNESPNYKREDLERRRKVVRHYRAPKQTRRYAERTYLTQAFRTHATDLVRANTFWRDYADHRGAAPFFSSNFAEAADHVTEMLLALAVLDLPFEAEAHESIPDGPRVTLKASTPLLLVRRETKETTPLPDAAPLLVTQALLQLDDRYRFEGGERRDKYVTDELLKGVAYGCRVVVTNPTPTPRKLELLMQIPQGAIPVKGGFVKRGHPARIAAFASLTVEYAFYFPTAGSYSHYPVHASQDGKLVASAQATVLKVVNEPTRIDTESWEHLSQSGSLAQVLTFLGRHNAHRLDLTKIAWRMKDAAAFRAVVSHLRARHHYENTLWSYALLHEDADGAREYLSHAERFLGRCGTYLESTLVKKDPVERKSYSHIEYSPLFNSRAHTFGSRHVIPNVDLAGQYRQLIRVLGLRPKLDDADRMSVTYYLLLQDRIEAARRTFARIDPKQLDSTLQYDYMRAYLDFFTDDHAVARGIAERYKEHPVTRWRTLFQNVINQLDEAEGRDLAAADASDRVQRQTELAAKQPSLDLAVEARRVKLSYQNLERCEVAYYEMDIEFLFSSSPFVQRGSGAFAHLRPNRKITVDLPKGATTHSFDLPAAYANKNVLVEVSAGGIVKRQSYYANSLSVRVIESYGQLKITHAESRKPMSKVYVKVFARTAGGVRFHKDGYTDLRGRFDYASLSGPNGSGVTRYAILVLSEKDGAVIREVAPPVE